LIDPEEQLAREEEEARRLEEAAAASRTTLTPGGYSTLPPLPMSAPVPVVNPPKSPVMALLLSVFPGLGQVYNGQPAKAFIFFFGWVASIYGTATISPFPFAFLIPFVYFYNLVDAWRSAALINQRVLGGGPEPEEETFESPWWGASLLGVGLLLLLNNLGWVRLSAAADWWPLIMVVAGGVFVWTSLRRRNAR
jgi:hypothetical protein